MIGVHRYRMGYVGAELKMLSWYSRWLLRAWLFIAVVIVVVSGVAAVIYFKCIIDYYYNYNNDHYHIHWISIAFVF